jgi:hypothetical protein
MVSSRHPGDTPNHGFVVTRLQGNNLWPALKQQSSSSVSRSPAKGTASSSKQVRHTALVATRRKAIAMRLASDRLPGFLRRGTIRARTRLACASAWQASNVLCHRR